MSMIYLSIALFGALALLFGLTVYLSRNMERRLFEKIQLMLKAAHLCASQIQTVDKRLETMQEEERQAFEFQRKASERHRVMLASLNRQVQQIETMVGPLSDTVTTAEDRAVDPTRTDSNAGKRDREDTPPSTVTSLRGTAGEAALPGVVKLEDMFRQIGGTNLGEIVQKHRKQVARTTRPLTDNMINGTDRLRRVSNG